MRLVDCSPWGCKESDTSEPLNHHQLKWDSPVAQTAKNLPANAGDPGSILESERSPGEGNGNPLHILAWKIPWTEEPGGLQAHRVTKGWT